jgi:hypothetical protein
MDEEEKRMIRKWIPRWMRMINAVNEEDDARDVG